MGTSVNYPPYISLTRTDHHCPWINNCVGHANYGHFIRFLFFVDLACSYHLVMVTKRVMASMAGHYEVSCRHFFLYGRLI